MILLVGGQKGGTGKSTIATNLAVWNVLRGSTVMLIDLDPQASSFHWASGRAAEPDLPTVHCIRAIGQSLISTLRGLVSEYDEIIIDVGGQDGQEVRLAMCAAHKMYTPVTPSAPDLWTLPTINRLYQNVVMETNPDLEVRVLLSKVSTNPKSNALKNSRRYVQESCPQLYLSEGWTHYREIYKDAFNNWRGVLEFNNGKANDEIRKVAEEIYLEHPASATVSGC